MPAEIRQFPDQVVMDLLARRGFADDEGLTGQVSPHHLVQSRQRVVIGQDNEDALGPQKRTVASGPVPVAGQEGDVEAKLPNGSDVFGWVTVDQFNSDVTMRPTIACQQLCQKA